jgi:hypothetical protein
VTRTRELLVLAEEFGTEPSVVVPALSRDPYAAAAIVLRADRFLPWRLCAIAH